MSSVRAYQRDPYLRQLTTEVLETGTEDGAKVQGEDRQKSARQRHEDHLIESRQTAQRSLHDTRYQTGSIEFAGLPANDPERPFSILVDGEAPA